MACPYCRNMDKTQARTTLCRGFLGTHLPGAGGLGGPGAPLSLLQLLRSALRMRLCQPPSQLIHLRITALTITTCTLEPTSAECQGSARLTCRLLWSLGMLRQHWSHIQGQNRETCTAALYLAAHVRDELLVARQAGPGVPQLLLSSLLGRRLSFQLMLEARVCCCGSLLALQLLQLPQPPGALGARSL